MSKYEKYMNDPDIIDEPMALREVHAIRLMIHDETKNMTPEQRADYTNRSVRKAEDELGIKFRRPEPAYQQRAVL